MQVRTRQIINEPVFMEQDNNHGAPNDTQTFLSYAQSRLTSGERRVQLLVEEPVLPVLLLLSDIAPVRLNLAQHTGQIEL